MGLRVYSVVNAYRPACNGCAAGTACPQDFVGGRAGWPTDSSWGG